MQSPEHTRSRSIHSSSASLVLPLRWMCLSLLFAFVAGDAQAIPRYSARYQQDCNLCHVNPSGGGKRTSYANQFLVPMEMTVLDWTEPEQIERLDPQVSESISIGADLRTLHLYSEDKAYRNGFFEMQADFYAQIELDSRFSLYLDQGQSQTREAFGLGYVLPANGYVKVGRFTPAYGWKFADHNLFSRALLGFAPPVHTDVGVELGFYPKDLTVQLTLHNGAGGSIIDDDHRPAATARVAARRRLLGVSASVGASYSYAESNAGLERTAGPFAALHWGPLTWVGESDWRTADTALGAGATEWISSQELAIALHQGFDFRITYDFFDPDLDTKSGTRSRWSFGVDTLLYPFLGVQASLHHATVEDGPAIGRAPEFTRSVLLAHFFF